MPSFLSISRKSRESGMSTVGVLTVATVLFVASASLVSMSRNSSKFRGSTDNISRAEQRHRAALTRVSALVNSGALWFDRADDNFVLRPSGTPAGTETVHMAKEVTRSPSVASAACGTYPVYVEEANAGVCGTEPVYEEQANGDVCGYTETYVTEANAGVCGTTTQYSWEQNAGVCGSTATYTWKADPSCGSYAIYGTVTDASKCGYTGDFGNGVSWATNWCPDWATNVIYGSSQQPLYQGTDAQRLATCVWGDYDPGNDSDNCAFWWITPATCSVQTGTGNNSCNVATGSSANWCNVAYTTANTCSVYKGSTPKTCSVKVNDTPRTCSVYKGQAPKSCTESYTEVIQVAESRPVPPAVPAEIACVSQDGGAWSVPNGKSWCFAPHNRAAPSDGKVHVLTYVCENTVGTNTSSAGASALQGTFCSTGQIPVQVDVSMESYMAKRSYALNANGSVVVNADGTERIREVKYWANVKASSSFNGMSSSLTSEMFVGTTAPTAKLDSAVGDTDFCYFMRPAAADLDREAMIYDGSGKSNVAQVALRPRNEGRSAGEYAGNVSLPALNANQVNAYSLMKPLQQQALGMAQEKGYRGLIVSVSNGSRDKRLFMGVEPRQAASGGPEFQYYLADGKDSGGNYSHAYRCTSAENLQMMIAQGWSDISAITVCSPTFDPAKVVRDAKGDSAYNSACKNTAGVDADFCNRVDMPWGTASASFTQQCIAKVFEGWNSKTVSTLKSNWWQKNVPKGGPQSSATPAPSDYESVLPSQFSTMKNKISMDLLLQVSCSPEWPETVSWFVQQVEERSKPTPTSPSAFEVYVQEIPALLNLDEAALQPMFDRISFSRALLDEAINYRVSKMKSSNGGNEKFKRVGNTLEIDGDALRYGFTYYEKVNLSPSVTLASYTAKRCVYMAYKNIAQPRQCSVQMMASDESASVCRTSDGCFAEETLIRMADGSSRRIADVVKNDSVWNPITGRAAKVTRMTVGPETKPMFRVTVEGRSVDVTDGHPFMTKEGWKKTSDLVPGTMVMSAQGLFLPVEVLVALPVGAEPPTVYNLALEGENDDDHFVLADGVVTGDLVIQERIGKK